MQGGSVSSANRPFPIPSPSTLTDSSGNSVSKYQHFRVEATGLILRFSDVVLRAIR